MDRPLALAFALLVVTAGLAAVPAATGDRSTPAADGLAATDGAAGVDRFDGLRQPPDPWAGSVARMTIDDPARTGRTTVDPSLAAALSSRTAALQSEHEVRTIERRFERMSTDRRSDFVIEKLIEVERDVNSLYRRQRQAIGAYANGTISETALLRRLAALDRRAAQVFKRIDLLYDLTNRLGITYLLNRLQRVEGLTEVMQGPVRALVAERLAADRSLAGIHVATTRNALVLATIVDGTYIRESVFLSNLESTGDRVITSAIGALAQVQRFYPWATDGDNRTSNYNIGTPGPFYRVRFTHRHGRLDVSIGARTGRVFREVQYLRLPRLPTDPVRNVTEDGLRVVLNRTYRGGPLRVEVYDASSGERVDATVTLDTRTLGPTGADGARWLVEPRAAYTLTVSTAGATATLNVSTSY